MDNSMLHGGLFFASVVLAGAGQFLDCQTSDVALAHGMIEANSIMAKAQAKIGTSGLFIVKCMGVPAIAALAFTFNWTYGLTVAIPFAVTGFIAGIKNYLLLRKNKISTFGV